MPRLPFRVCAVAVCLLFVSVQAFAATTLLNTGGFEAYNASPTGIDLAGQTTAGQPGPWLEASQFQLGSESTAVVQTSVAESGTKAVRVDRVAGDDAYWGVPVSSVPFPGDDLIIVEWDMKVEYANVVDGFGPLFGVFAFDGGSTPKTIGSVSVDANTGEILYQAEGSGVLTVASGVEEVDNQWHQYRMAFDYTNNAYQVMYDGQLVVTQGFVDNGVTAFTDADIATIAAGFDAGSQNAEGTAYFDNFVVANFGRLPGDYDVDGDVDPNDYLVWQSSYGATSVAGLGADGNGDGIVDAADYTVWRDNFGSFVQAPSAGLSAAPEPTSLLLASLGSVAFGLRRRR